MSKAEMRVWQDQDDAEEFVPNRNMTVTKIYKRARAKISDCIVNGKLIRIARDNYELCDGSA